ncbi:MAG: TlpA family protein disulfide reductase [Ilumatobacter sp.]|jgi:peroxiredoxin|uniref:TlpA family protein disulfide reductase n=1 Tax=Ilumatobacter sp. TaxID=1967498 RepID=UPI00391CD794
MNISRPRLLIGSLSVALVLGVAGGLAWAQLTGDDDEGVDASLDEPGVVDREVSSIETIPSLSGDRLPDATVSDREGASISTASFVGQPLVINFWFSTCVPCAKELVDFAEVDAEVGDDVRFIGINPFDSVPIMERFAGERGVTYDLFRDDDVEFQQALEIAFFPYTLFVTSDGTIVEQTGVLDADGLREKVANLLENDT